MITVSADAAQGLLLMVHTNVSDVPANIPVIAEVGDDGVVMLPAPDNKVHNPVPKAGALAANTEEVDVHKS